MFLLYVKTFFNIPNHLNEEQIEQILDFFNRKDLDIENIVEEFCEKYNILLEQEKTTFNLLKAVFIVHISKQP